MSKSVSGMYWLSFFWNKNVGPSILVLFFESAVKEWIFFSAVFRSTTSAVIYNIPETAIQ